MSPRPLTKDGVQYDGRPMTVKQLIAALLDCDMNAEVYASLPTRRVRIGAPFTPPILQVEKTTASCVHIRTWKIVKED